MLKQTEQISKNKTKLSNLVLASLISSIYVVVMIVFKISELNWFLSKLFLAVIICYISFKPKDIPQQLKQIILFFLISIINVGTIVVIKNLTNIQIVSGVRKIILYIVMYGISTFITKTLWKIYERNINLEELIYNVEFAINKKVYKYKGFLDTGNTVYSFTENVPIIFAEIKEGQKQDLLKHNKKTLVQTITLSANSEKTAYIVEEIKISKGNQNYVVKAGIVFENINLSKTQDYNMILNYKLFNEQLGGIKV